MAADSLTCFGDDHVVPSDNSPTQKIRQLGDAVIGISGWAIYQSILDDHLRAQSSPDLSSETTIFRFFMTFWKALHDDYPFVNDQANSRDSPFGDLDSSFLIASPGGLFKVSSDAEVSRFHRYYAIGSGSEYALGALGAINDSEPDGEVAAREAVRVASLFDTHCGGDAYVLTVPLQSGRTGA